MIKTNSRTARERIRAYIMENVVFSNWDIENPATFKQTAELILTAFRKEKSGEYYRRYSEETNFIDYAQGLPSCGLFDYYLYYIENPVCTLGDILEQTETERARFSEDQAAELLTKLIYKELINAK